MDPRAHYRGGRQRARPYPALELEHQQGAPGHLWVPRGPEVQRPSSCCRSAASVRHRPALALLPFRDQLQVEIYPGEAFAQGSAAVTQESTTGEGKGVSEVPCAVLSRSWVPLRAHPRGQNT